MSKVLLVGSARPKQAPKDVPALHNSLTWKRLAHFMEVDPEDLKRLVDTTNLLPEWPEGKDPYNWTNARVAVAHLLNRCRQDDRKRIILLGPKIAKAFGYSWSEANCYFEWRRIEGIQVSVIPNPVSDWWNVPEKARRGGLELRAAIGLPTLVG